ncbi:MAG: sarcosine oxidase subunit gamma [Halieaceae bacterium]|jgi:sarcosine oxidase subunit gamma
MTIPSQFTARSPLYRWHEATGATFEAQRDAACVYGYQDPEYEVDRAKKMGLVDLSTLNRVGFKGPDSLRWIQHRGLVIPDQPNQSCLQGNGSLITRLSHEELLILDNPASKVPDLEQLQLREPGNHELSQVYRLPRRDSHCWFWVLGIHAPTMFSKVCGIDLRLQKFLNGSIAQTSLARLNAIIIRNDAGLLPGFFVLSDLTSAEFLWTCLLDAMEEFDGAPIGIEAVRQLINEPRP